LWVNLGDSYTAADKMVRPFAGAGPARESGVLPGKHLVGVPWRVAFALQASGWWLRNAVVWAKSNPMPESVTDRLSTTYELLFLLTPSPRYHFDLDPIRVPLVRPDAVDGTRTIGGARKGTTGGVGATQRRRGAVYGPATGKHADTDVVVQPGAGRGNLAPQGRKHTAAHPRGRNPGDVWRLATRPYRGAHVAPFPVDIPLRAIAAGCPPGGVVLDPFSGAATTGLAALRLGRSYIGVDVRAEFHDEALARLRPHLPSTSAEAGG
jgi:site-specific DNA-methyltransferase (cytosine-N4-specific)